ncbi:DUF177 domain-containing protein [Psychromarinibacter sp. C21-152]|uniref:DUF177 domain-containing protein n=1 Tax=Psychromarinibacter sediminicola TaxID=3033385 RepID=A0AAE3T8Y8_9RHOB|nr:DUF177 domain-containing protein [Psychromarinibacter sediminicola]MDF0600025.1 DUF177 domain-containing protein [Psychromarinibacter sediminicola]
MDDPARPVATAPKLRLSSLPRRADQPFRLEPDADTRAALAQELGLSSLRKLRLEGRLSPEDRDDWRLEAMLGATVVQPCVATLAPVTTRIDLPVERLYTADPPPLPAGDEVEVPEDDHVEELPAVLDLAALMAEELALALPAYPRAEGAAPVEEISTPPGAAPIEEEEETKPFAGLAALRDKIAKDDE